MDFSEISWVSEMDFVESCLTETTTTESSPILMSSIPSTNSITSLISTEEYFTQFLTMDDSSVVEQPQTTKPQNSPTNDSTVTFSTATTHPIILNFKNGNMGSVDSGNNNSGVKSNRPLDPEEEAIVTEVLRSQDMLFSDPKDKSKCVVEVRKVKPSRTRAASQHYDHAIGERNRREHLRQKFLTLAAMVPGLKKSDKISVLGDAIKYMQHLQERVTALEALEKKHTAANNKESSAGEVKKSPLATTAPLESKDNNKEEAKEHEAGPAANSPNPEKVPVIEATLSNNNQILLKIQCEKRKGVLVNLLGVLETLNVTVVNSNATTFGESNLDVTVVAEMEKGCDVMVNEVVKSLRGALQN